MKILLIGYGKMGHVIEGIALLRQHQICGRIQSEGLNDSNRHLLNEADVAIEFTRPEAALNNIRVCIEAGLPVVSGTTGWLEQKPEAEAYAYEKGGAFFHATNFSVGVNLFIHFNRLVAQVMQKYPEYRLSLQETHHTQKKDAPSGTAITLAEEILKNYPLKEGWALPPAPEGMLEIEALRVNDVPGTHKAFYTSEVDTIELTHTAHSRQGFALGAVLAAEFLIGKKGSFGMEDLLGF
jgi:4-hydroxy-tetrahydrodipicolinate reductase